MAEGAHQKAASALLVEAAGPVLAKLGITFTHGSNEIQESLPLQT